MARKKGKYTVTRDGFVNIKHKGVGTAKVRPESVPVWLDKGWVLSDAEKKSEPAETAVVIGTDQEK